MLKQRVITAVILLLVALPALFHPSPVWLGILGLALIAAAAWEWGRLNGLGLTTAFSLPAACVGVFFGYWTGYAFQPLPPIFWLACVVVWFGTIVFFLRLGSASWQATPKWIRLVLGLVLLIPSGMSLLQAKLVGTAFLTSVLCLVWTADIAAYFAGRRWGKHKLAPTISPGKSIEGLAGAVMAVWLLAIGWTVASASWGMGNDHVFARLLAFGWPVFFAGLTLLTLASAAGDLFESLIKRAAGAKDSSQLLPGHGGVLDRLDALLPVLPLAVLISMW